MCVGPETHPHLDKWRGPSSLLNGLYLTVAMVTLTWGQMARGVGTGWVAGDTPYGNPPPSRDPRITTHEDLLMDRSIRKYQSESIVDYAQLLVDIPRHQIIVGARNHVLRLNMSTLEELERVEWVPDQLTSRICQAKGPSFEECQNYIRVLVQLGEEIFVCGTNAFSPKCAWRKAADLSDVRQFVNGVAKCPYHPRHNNTALITPDGNLYSATVTDFTARDAAIFRKMGPSKHLRTVQYNSRWLNEPDFISSYEIGDFIYFFFRESAIEYINCGKNIYSRVARICKNDQGGNFLLEDNWTSFVKTRLNCSLPGTHPFYFNELQNTYFVPEEQLLYAIFTTSPTSIYGTAVCVYNITAFHTAFAGAYKYQEDTRMVWTRVPNDAPQQCSQPPRSGGESRRAVPPNHTPGQRLLVDAMKFQIMDEAVQPVDVSPLLIAEGERFTHIAMDSIKTKHHNRFKVIFVLTLEGAMKKLIQVPGSRDTCLVEEIRILGPGSPPGLVRSFRLSNEKGVVYVGTEDAVYRIPMHRCERFPDKIACVGAQDPYCGWDSNKRQCTTLPKTLPLHRWHQNISSCPIRAVPGNGGWTDWSDWETCEHRESTSRNPTLGSPSPGGPSPCRCRHRTCSVPQALYGEDQCVGPAVEVTNCTVHGRWTSWSEWSECSATCGVAVRSRHRECGNPEPRFGGRICIGPRVNEKYCMDNPICTTPPPAPVDGGWSAWSRWSVCNKACGGGMQARRRDCSSPVPRLGGKHCQDNNEEWRMCHTEPCDERRKTEWSDWQVVNTTREGHSEERFRFTCRAPVEDEDLIRIGNVKKNTRFCPRGSEDCAKREPEIEEPVWSPWSGWTTCSTICGGGSQSRQRLCLSAGGGPLCEGHGREVRICNTHSCQGEWSCWSDYSSCSTSCGAGRRWRKRQCQTVTPGGHFTQPCPGSDREEIPCTGQPDCQIHIPPEYAECADSQGWAEWSHWSACEPQNVHTRVRKCCSDFPYERCTGTDQETRICQHKETPRLIHAAAQDNTDDVAVEVDVAEIQDSSMEGVQATRTGCRECFCMYHLIIVGIVGFVLGGAICVGIFLYCQRQHQENKEQNRYNTLQRLHNAQQLPSPQDNQDTKQNEYLKGVDLANCQSDVDLIPTGVGNQYYSTGSLKRKDSYKSMTVKEASQKRDSLMRTHSMRTNLSLSTGDY